MNVPFAGVFLPFAHCFMLDVYSSGVREHIAMSKGSRSKVKRPKREVVPMYNDEIANFGPAVRETEAE